MQFNVLKFLPFFDSFCRFFSTVLAKILFAMAKTQPCKTVTQVRTGDSNPHLSQQLYLLIPVTLMMEYFCQTCALLVMSSRCCSDIDARVSTDSFSHGSRNPGPPDNTPSWPTSVSSPRLICVLASFNYSLLSVDVDVCLYDCLYLWQPQKSSTTSKNSHQSTWNTVICMTSLHPVLWNSWFKMDNLFNTRECDHLKTMTEHNECLYG